MSSSRESCGATAAGPVSTPTIECPVEEIATLGRSPALQLTAASGERRKQPRPEEKSRIRGRAVEFAGVVAICAGLAGAGATMVEAAFARPLALVSAALAN